MAKLFGYKPNPEETEWILGDPDVPVWTLSPSDSSRIAKQNRDGTPVILFDALKAIHPNWKRGAQGIGDCVAWGFELACTIVTAVDIYHKKQPWMWKGEYATEPIYGGSRVEARGRSQGGWSDGSYGGAAAKWLTKWGALRRLNYSIRTGVAEHDLSRYDSKKAKNWGNWGCGGQPDSGKLDSVAKEFPVREAYLVTKYEDAVSAIENGWPIAVCSGQGLGQRNSDGFAPPRGSWSHCCLPGTIVSGSTWQSIDSLVPGSLVVTSDGSYQRVTEKFSRVYEGKVVNVKATGCNISSYTDEHPVLVYRKNPGRFKWRNELPLSIGSKVSGGVDVSTIDTSTDSECFFYVQAKDLTVGDYIVSPVRKFESQKIVPEWEKSARCKNVPLRLTPNSTSAWAIGLYLADGTSVKSHKLCWTLSPQDDIERLKSFIESIGLKPHVKDFGKYVRVYCYSSVVANSFKKWFGGGTTDKTIPAWLTTWDIESLINGLIDGDGCRYRGKTIFNNVSKPLCIALLELARSIGKLAKINECLRSSGSFENARPMYEVRWMDSPKRSEIIAIGNYLAFPVKRVDVVDYFGAVYNLEVEENHSYVSDSIVSHNCMCFTGVRYDKPGLLCTNSWGNSWGTSNPFGPGLNDYWSEVRKCSAWVDARTVEGMLRQQDSYVICGVDGLEPRTIDWSLGWEISGRS